MAKWLPLMGVSGSGTAENSVISKQFLPKCGTDWKRCGENDQENHAAMDDFQSRIDKKLRAQADRNLLRTLRVMPGNLQDFTSNDDLGLARSEALAHRISQRLANGFTFPNGSGGSRLLSGNSMFAEEAERFLATIGKAAAALL